MSSSRGFSNTQPASGAKRSADIGPQAATGDSSDFRLAGVIGTQLSEPLMAMRQVLQQFDQTRSISSSQMRLLRSSLDNALSVGKKSQQIARLATGRLRQSHERVKLDEILHDCLLEYSAVFQERGIELYQKLKPVEVIVDPSLLTSLLEATLDWAMGMGQRLVVTLDMKNWPEHGVLLIKTSERVAAASSAGEMAEGENLAWYLLHQIAKAMGVSVEKVSSDRNLSMMIEFPRTVRRLEGLTAIEMETGFDTLNSESKPLAGLRMLVITNDDRLRSDIASMARSMSLVADFAPTTSQAVRFCELDAPHLVIIDERVRDHIFEELKDDLRVTDPNYPFIEIASESNTLEVAGWMSNSMTRLSRDSLQSQLPSILVLELAKVM